MPSTQRQRRETEAYRTANGAFHETLYAASRNSIVSNQIRTTRARIRGMRDMRFEHPARVRASLAEHHFILQAVLQGKEDEAGQAMARHIAAGRGCLCRHDRAHGLSTKSAETFSGSDGLQVRMATRRACCKGVSVDQLALFLQGLLQVLVSSV